MYRNLIFWSTVLLGCLLASQALGVQFNHDEHSGFILVCTYCHKEDAGNMIPPREDCLRCHEQDLVEQISFAEAETHGPVWPMAHGQAARENKIDCNGCHQVDFCYECHQAAPGDKMSELSSNMANPHRPDFRLNHADVAAAKPQTCSTCHGRTSCTDCHTRMKYGDQQVQFDHDNHLALLEKEQVCISCHKEDAGGIIPAKGNCHDCHAEDFIGQVSFPGTKTHGPVWSMNHRAAAKGNSYDCSACHDQSYCMDCHKAGFADEMGELGNNMINVHRSEFMVSHPIPARTDPQLCSSCHENKFCSDCHANFAPQDLAILSHRRGWSGMTADDVQHDLFTPDMCQTCHPDSVLPAHQWSQSHAREARKNLVVCQSCHPEGDTCLTCHSAKTGLRINPHPKDWDDMKNRLRDASDNRTCRKCH
jgi:hypothetical protein